MIWLTLRQFRTQAAYVFGGFALLAIYVLINGLSLHHYFDVHDLANCNSPSCDAQFNTFTTRAKILHQFLGPLLLVFPAIIGVFWGAPLVARELESGTFRMVWTQGVSRRRWLLAKIAIPGLASVAITALFSLLVTWWSSRADSTDYNRFAADIFAERNLAPVGYAAFAFALGVCAGIVLRKPLQAMATTIVGYVGMQVLTITQLRPNYESAKHAVGPIPGPPDGPTGGKIVQLKLTGRGDWILSNTVVNAAGKSTDRIQIRPNSECAGTGQCVSDYHQHLTYQPANRYWTFQWYEFSLYLGLAAVLIAASFWLIRRRLT